MTNKEVIEQLKFLKKVDFHIDTKEACDIAISVLEENDKLKAEIEQLKAELEQSVKLPFTNADKIRSMSDEGLAKFIAEKVEQGLCFYTGSSSDAFGFNRESELKIHLSWLKSEVEE